MGRLTRAANLAKVMSDCKLSKGPIIDTATDTDVIGSDSVACATNTQSCKPFEYETISGGGVSNERADLATPLVTMLAAPVVKTSRSSIMSASTIHDAGFTIVSNSDGLSLQKDGVATEAIPDGNMYRMPVVDRARVDDEVNHAVRLHKKTVMARILKKMILHRKRGHRPSDPVDCHGCALQLTRTPARRLKPEAKRKAESRGHVAGIDYITGLPPDNDGNTAVFGLVVASREKNQSVAWYQPVKSHSGEDAIAAFKECEFRVSLMFPPGEFKLARVHSDCEKSLIGPLCDGLKARGIWPTNTEGYDHNGNAVVENRNRTLQQGVRAALVTATGGRSRYSEVWGTAFVHINDCVNHTSYAGETSPVENCGGEPVDLESEGSGVYGALVRFYRAKERRDGKLDSNGAFGMYAGRSFTVPGGHRVIELVWNHESKRFDLMPTIDVKTWIGDNEAALASKLPPTPFTDPGPLLRLLVATMATSAGATSGSTAAAGATAPSGGGGGGSGGGRDGLLAEALDTTKLPSAKGEDGHEKVVPLPAGFLSMVQAEAIVPKRHLLDAALGLGQSAAGADACANLGVIQNVVDSVTGEVTRVRQSDEALGWAMTQDIATATSSGGSERAKTARSLHSAQGVVINHVTAMIKKASYGGDVHGSFQPTPTMVGNMLKGMIIGSRSHFVRETMTDRHHDYGPWMCVPMSVPNRPRSTQQFFEWYFAKGAYTEQGRPMFVGEKALSAWCKVIDACGDVFATAYRDDCLKYIEVQNDKLQRQLEDQSFLDLFLGGFYKLDILNAAYQRDNTPSPKPRLNGVFEGLSMVSPTILEIIKADLIKLTSDPVARSEFPILNMVPNMIPRVSRLPSPSPTMLGGRGSRSGGQLEIAFPSGGAVLQGTELQLGLGGGRRSAMASTSQYGPSSGDGTPGAHAGSGPSNYKSLPPPPRKAGILPDSELMSSDEIRQNGVITLFKSEPLLNRKCVALYLREDGCPHNVCHFCLNSLRDAPSIDQRDLAQALRRATGSSNARSRPPTPGDRRERSDSAGSARSLGSQNSDGGGHKPKQRRN